LTRKKRRDSLPIAALEQMMSAAKAASEKAEEKTARDIFKKYLVLIDKYRDYFFSEPWPEKWNIKHATIFTREDTDFIDENDDEFVERVMAVLMKKNISLEGFNGVWGMFWSWQAYWKQFVKPDLKECYEAFKELVKTGADAEEILKRLLEQEDISFVHMSLVELLKDDCCLWDNKPLDLKTAEVLELVHTKRGYPECEEDLCKRQREKTEK
jgi:hypothetical protein